MFCSIWARLSACGAIVVVMLLGPSTSRRQAAPVRDEHEITNSIGMKLMHIPAGKFTMGSPADDKESWGNEEQHEETIAEPFYLSSYTVTVGQFRQFAKEAGHKTEAEQSVDGGWGYYAPGKAFAHDTDFNWQSTGWDQTEIHPVVNVSWNDAQAFCKWLSKKEGKEYRLPTEVEWEYACRAGTKTRFHSGDSEESLKGVANVADVSLMRKYPQIAGPVAWDDGYPFTAPVGKFKPNAFGLYDTHGNVRQWCQDWYIEKPPGDGDPEAARTWMLKHREELTMYPAPTQSSKPAVRGGSFSSDTSHCRSAYRGREPAGSWAFDLGFRVAAVPDSKDTQ